MSSLLLFVSSCSVSFFTSLSLHQGKKKLPSLCCLPPPLHTFSSLTISTFLFSYPISPSSPVLFNFLLHTCHRLSVRSSSTYKCICLLEDSPSTRFIFMLRFSHHFSTCLDEDNESYKRPVTENCNNISLQD